LLAWLIDGNRHYKNPVWLSFRRILIV
jgi:hypothetical protein